MWWLVITHTSSFTKRRRSVSFKPACGTHWTAWKCIGFPVTQLRTDHHDEDVSGFLALETSGPCDYIAQACAKSGQLAGHITFSKLRLSG